MTKKPFNSVVIPTEGYVVSQQTARFVHAFRTLDAVYSEMFDAIENLYGDRVDDIMDDEFWNSYDSARSVIMKYLSISIEISLSDLANSRNQNCIEV